MVVEWGELAAPALAPDCLHVAIDFGSAASEPHGTADPASAADPADPADVADVADVADAASAPSAASANEPSPGAEGARRLVFTAGGPSWYTRMGALAAAVGAAGAT